MIHSGNGTSRCASLGRGDQAVWETTGTDRLPIDLGVGSQPLDIEWVQRKNFLDMGGATPAECKTAQQPGTTCKGTFTNATRRSAVRGRSPAP